jgi:hypothetical protein
MKEKNMDLKRDSIDDVAMQEKVLMGQLCTLVSLLFFKMKKNGYKKNCL